MGPSGSINVIDPPRGVEPIDAHDYLARAETTRFGRGHALQPRALLGIRRNPILEVEDNGVAGQRLCLLPCPGIVTRHVEHAAADMKAHGGLAGNRRPSMRQKE
jgi:hypothetical protein